MLRATVEDIDEKPRRELRARQKIRDDVFGVDVSGCDHLHKLKLPRCCPTTRTNLRHRPDEPRFLTSHLPFHSPAPSSVHVSQALPLTPLRCNTTPVLADVRDGNADLSGAGLLQSDGAVWHAHFMHSVLMACTNYAQENAWWQPGIQSHQPQRRLFVRHSVFTFAKSGQTPQARCDTPTAKAPTHQGIPFAWQRWVHV